MAITKEAERGSNAMSMLLGSHIRGKRMHTLGRNHSEGFRTPEAGPLGDSKRDRYA